jgi:hypothetical protein
MKLFLAFNLLVLLMSGCHYNSVMKRSNIEYAEDQNISLKEDSKTGRRPVYFFSSTYRTRGPGGGGFGFGK